MLTNPNTCGLFERQIVGIAEAVHEAGAYFYCDGANFNAIVGKTRPGDLGVDAMHINLHKTFSTPHGGGGPGAGPVALSSRLAPYAPVPFVVRDGDALAPRRTCRRLRVVWPHERVPRPDGHVRPRAELHSLAWRGRFAAGLRGRGAVRQLRAGLLNDVMSAPFGDRPCMHEALFDDRWLKDTGLTTLDFAKAMIDEGYHPMTVYFPLIVHGAMLIEPTKSESKASLDLFIMTLRDLAFAVKAGDRERFLSAPVYAPRRRLDETRAARQPVLRWTRPAPGLRASWR